MSGVSNDNFRDAQEIELEPHPWRCDQEQLPHMYYICFHLLYLGQWSEVFGRFVFAAKPIVTPRDIYQLIRWIEQSMEMKCTLSTCQLVQEEVL